MCIVLQIMKLLVMEFSPVLSSLLPFESKYFPKHLVFKPPQTMTFPLNARLSSTAITGNVITVFRISRGFIQAIMQSDRVIDAISRFRSGKCH
jgi:hypothetical protein